MTVIDDDNRKLLYKREWLNEDEGRAYVILSAELYSQGGSCDVSVEIADCHRHIGLDFWFGDEDEQKKKLEKMDRLIALLQEAREVIVSTKLVPKDKSKDTEIITVPEIE
jgi:hypothetical protein